MNRLYLLAFLLTGDESTAEQCFVGGLEDSHQSNPVFREWAQSWARRTVIGNAIRIMHPRPGDAFSQAADGAGRVLALNLPDGIAAILDLPAFERFAFVMRVLEGYSERECCLLLDCSASDLSVARIHAFQQIAAAANRQDKAADDSHDRDGRDEDGMTAFAGKGISHLAASA